MKNAAFITAFSLLGVHFSSLAQNNQLDNLSSFKNSLTAILLKQTTWKELSAELKNEGSNPTKAGLKYETIYKNPCQAVGGDCRVRDYDENFNEVAGVFSAPLNAGMPTYTYSFRTNRRRADDLSTNIDSIKVLDYRWTINDTPVEYAGKRELRREIQYYNKLYSDLLNIVNGMLGQPQEASNTKEITNGATKLKHSTWNYKGKGVRLAMYDNGSRGPALYTIILSSR